jgi:hypothetical protein
MYVAHTTVQVSDNRSLSWALSLIRLDPWSSKANRGPLVRDTRLLHLLISHLFLIGPGTTDSHHLSPSTTGLRQRVCKLNPNRNRNRNHRIQQSQPMILVLLQNHLRPTSVRSKTPQSKNGKTRDRIKKCLPPRPVYSMLLPGDKIQATTRVEFGRSLIGARSVMCLAQKALVVMTRASLPSNSLK